MKWPLIIEKNEIFDAMEFSADLLRHHFLSLRATQCFARNTKFPDFKSTFQSIFNFIYLFQ